MLAEPRKSTKKTILYIAIIVSMIVGNVLIYNNSKQKPQIDPNQDLLLRLEEEYGIVTDKTSGPSSLIEHNPVLKHNLFFALEKIGDWPVVPKNVGRINPFLPLE